MVCLLQIDCGVCVPDLFALTEQAQEHSPLFGRRANSTTISHNIVDLDYHIEQVITCMMYCECWDSSDSWTAQSQEDNAIAKVMLR